MAKSKKKASKTVTTQKQAKKGESSRVKQVAGRKRTAHENSETDNNEPQQSRQRSKRARNMPNIDEVHEKETSESENEVINVENSEDDAVVVEEKDEIDNDDDCDDESLETYKQKIDSTKDLLLIFTDRKTVKFTSGTTAKVETGRWCEICKEKPPKGDIRNAFFLGGNSSCRTHIRSHYKEYEKRCNEANIELNHHAIPRPIWKKMKEKKNAKGKIQGTLDDMLQPQKPKEFRRENVLDAVAKLVACGDESLELANSVWYRNSLAAMRPNATNKDVPSGHDVSTYIHNEFVNWVKGMRENLRLAPGKISTTCDAWMAGLMRKGFLGVTGHWIEVIDGKWALRSELIGFTLIVGEHTGLNLGWHFARVCDRVGVWMPEQSKLGTITLDNASNNGTLCDTVKSLHDRRQYPFPWSADENQLPCFAHIINLAVVAFMSRVTKIAVVDNANLIWEYDPLLPDNRIEGGLDRIAALRTVITKINASPQRMEYFEKLQAECRIKQPAQLCTHSNVRWGSAEKMLRTAYDNRSPICLFILSADKLFGPITTLRRDGRIVKKIPWGAFQLTDEDWGCINDIWRILDDANKIQQYFSSETNPTLWRAIPAIEELQTAWGNKLKSPRFSKYKVAIHDGLEKLHKYYNHLDAKPSYILSLILHPVRTRVRMYCQGGDPDRDGAQELSRRWGTDGV